MKSRTYPGKNKTVKYLRKIDFSQRNQNPLKNSKSLEKSIDNSSVQIFNFSRRLLLLTSFPQQNLPSPPLGRIPPTP